MAAYRLSVLDQSPIAEGMTAADALTNTPEAVVASAARPGASSATSTATSPASGQTTVPQGGTTAVARTETEPSPRLGLAATR